MSGAMRELIRHPIRTLLICQGILWAMTLMVAPAAILEGSRSAAVDRSGELGTDRIQLEAEDGSPRPLETEDLAALNRRLSEADPQILVTGITSFNARYSASRSTSGWVLAGDSRQPDARSLKLQAGRWFQGGAAVPEAVVESALADRWLDTGDKKDAKKKDGDEITGDPVSSLLGKEVWIAPGSFGSWRSGLGPSDRADAQVFRIVGVMAPTAGIDPLGFGKDHTFSSMVEGVLKMLGVAPDSAPWLEAGLSVHVDRTDFAAAEGEVDWVVIKTDPTEVQRIGDLAEETLLTRGCTPLVYSNAAWAILASPELDGYLVLHDVFFVISAVTGFIVLANLLLLTGRRRRGEVGLRRAEGATRFDIFFQFLWEGILIGLTGAVLGTIVAMILAMVRAQMDPSVLLEVSWPWGTILDSTLIVTIGAALASAGPAWSVSGVDPASLLSERR